MRRFLTLAFACLAFPIAAGALTIEISGEVLLLEDASGSLDGVIGVGTPFEAIYTLDPTPSGPVSFSEGSLVDAPLGPAHLHLTIGPVEFDASLDPQTISYGRLDYGPVSRDYWYSGFFQASDTTPSLPLGPGEIGFQSYIVLRTQDDVITSLDPFIPTDIAAWDSPVLRMHSFDEFGFVGGIGVGMTIHQWTVVPEPASGGLLALGLVLVSSWRRATARVISCRHSEPERTGRSRP